MNINLFDYDLPKELIAQSPLANRSDSRLLILDKKTGALAHDYFYNIGNYLCAGDCLVLNDTKVIPARLTGSLSGGGAAEVLLLERISDNNWEAIVKPGKKLRDGAEITFGTGIPKLIGKVIEVLENGNRIISFEYDGIFEETLDALGQMPLPPYITETLTDKTRYQTVYAKHDGSAAAPTAGLHFTSGALAALEAKGVKTACITLHVGLGTFRPVKEQNTDDHKMHSERFIISKAAADTINSAKKAGGRVVCVGTTSCRALEAASGADGAIDAMTARTDIFIFPGYRFKTTDCLITNFHLPKSTLLMLVSALAGRENVLNAYKTAVSEGYRFFSFGDAMIIQ